MTFVKKLMIFQHKLHMLETHVSYTYYARKKTYQQIKFIINIVCAH